MDIWVVSFFFFFNFNKQAAVNSSIQAVFAQVFYYLYYFRQNSWKGRFADQRVCSFRVLISIAKLLSKDFAPISFTSWINMDTCFHHTLVSVGVINLCQSDRRKGFLIVTLSRISLRVKSNMFYTHWQLCIFLCQFFCSNTLFTFPFGHCFFL